MNVGVAIIGRNEGERLRRCLESVSGVAKQIVYVDSGSTDDSVALAHSLKVEVIELDMTIPFCAARARNAGYERLVQCHPQLRYVQFIDGDCEIISDWISEAVIKLEYSPDMAIVSGWLHERFPEASIYNRLADLEWNSTDAGDVEAVGGIFMVRCEAFDSVGGFDTTVPAGEEPELCQRLLQQGWRIHRLDRSMALHDLAMFRFGQWWRRMQRFGYGSMDVAARFGLPRFRRSNQRTQGWVTWLAVVLAGAILGVAAPQLREYCILLTLALLCLWPIRWCRITYRTMMKGHTFTLAATYAFFTSICFLPQIAGHLMYWSDRLRKKSFRLVEYKTPINCGTGRDS